MKVDINKVLPFNGHANIQKTCAILKLFQHLFIGFFYTKTKNTNFSRFFFSHLDLIAKT